MANIKKENVNVEEMKKKDEELSKVIEKENNAVGSEDVENEISDFLFDEELGIKYYLTNIFVQRKSFNLSTKECFKYFIKAKFRGEYEEISLIPTTQSDRYNPNAKLDASADNKIGYHRLDKLFGSFNELPLCYRKVGQIDKVTGKTTYDKVYCLAIFDEEDMCVYSEDILPRCKSDKYMLKKLLARYLKQKNLEKNTLETEKK